MPFDDVVKSWGSLRDHSAKNQASQKAYMTQLNAVGGAFSRTAGRIAQAEAHVAKLVNSYKMIVAETKDLGAELQKFIDDGESLNPPDGNAGLLKSSVLPMVKAYRVFVEKNMASLLKEKRKL